MPIPFATPTPAQSASVDKSVHYELVKKAIPSWLLSTSTSSVKALKTVRLTLPDWHRNASATAHQNLKNDMQLAWTAHNDIDRALSNLQDVYAFAKPLLQQALKDRYGVEDDVEETWLRLYAPRETSWWVIDFSSSTRARTVSLLDAALHNFSSGETFTADSGFITRPDARGHFDTRHLLHKISIEQFTSLCRELNIGALYEQHLRDYLLSTNPVASNVLRYKVTLNQKRALKVAAHMALMKNDIGQHAHHVIQGLIDNHRNPHWNGHPVSYYTLEMMDAALTGIVLITYSSLTGNTPAPLIAYVPHDPEHPLKEYPSSLQFMAELTRQLRSAEPGANYQQFFSRFVAHNQRGHFFANLNARLSKVTWQPAPPGSNLPSWRDTPVNNPNLQFRVTKFEEDRQLRYSGDPWDYLYKRSMNKILNDAREIAITTEYADRMARWAWWDNLEKMLSDIFNVALLVLTPFVPGLGELMLAYTAFQLTNEVVEGIVDLAEGHLVEAAEQAIGVLESVAQLAAFAGGTALGNYARTQLSPFFEGLKPVQSANGQTRLWHPDLAPYQRPDIVLPTTARPDRLGIYQHQEQSLVRLDDRHYQVRQDPVTGQHRIQHPQRADAYAPTLQHNGHGAWVSETENPRQWQGSTLMRRLGHSTDGYSDQQLELIRQVSGSEEAELRRMHVELAPPPPLLSDTLQRIGSTASPAPVPSPEIGQLFSEFPDLPEDIAQRILASATPSEHQRITQNKRLPLRLKTRARELQFETRSVRAAQGLYLDSLSSIDTERLALGALRMYTDTFADLRIEIRQGTFDGELRCDTGSENATRVRVLIRDATGKYTVRDGLDQPIHAAEGLFEALLHATQNNGRNILGYRPGDGESFRQWVIARTTPTERRTVLATPPLRPVVEHETLLLVRGGGLSRDGATLHDRIRDLYPHFSEREVDTYADALTEQGEPLRAMEREENDLDELRTIVNRWEYQQAQTWGPGANSFRDDGGQHIVERLIECFRRKNTELDIRTDPASYSLDLSRELLPLDLETWWSKRPVLKKFLDKVTELKLDNTRFSIELNGILKDFPNLRELSAKGCELTTLPKRLETMPRLERLRLSDNRIVLDLAAVNRLKKMTRLEILRLDGNPLGMSPDIGRMPRLKVVGLKKTGLSTWPDGTFSKRRPRGFLLDLRDNPITRIPEVIPRSTDAWVVARTRLNLANLSDINRVLYQDVRRTVALPPEPVIPSTGQIDPMISIDHWSDVPGWGIDRATLWSDLIDEPRAQRFMEVLVNTQDSADYRAGGLARDQLRQRIWRMLDAVQIDSRLREELFTMAIAPVDCADAGAQLFNNMGIRVLASEAYSYSTDRVELENKLVTLAKGAARLEQVNEIARADVASRGGNPDDVEVYLAYQTGLAQRLGLPWQSEGMLFRPVSGVTDAMVDQAYDTVLTLEEGDGLVNKMLEQYFWENYLRERYPARMETNKRAYLAKYERLETLRSVQREWTQAADTDRGELRNRLQELMNDLPVPATVVFADEPISDAIFDRLLVDLGDEEKELSRRLTREALRRAGQ